MSDAGDKASEEEKEAIGAAGSWKIIETDDKESIEAKIQTLSEASASLKQKM